MAHGKECHDFAEIARLLKALIHSFEWFGEESIVF
jgi:hypothetical protein